MLGDIIKSLVILCIISSVTAGCLYTDTLSFVRYFFIATFLQIVCFNIYRKIASLLHEQNEVRRLEELSKQVVEVRCPCPKLASQIIPISVNETNSYKCQDCNRSVVAVTDVKTFLATEPVDIDQGTKLVEKLYNDALKNKPNGTTSI